MSDLERLSSSASECEKEPLFNVYNEHELFVNIQNYFYEYLEKISGNTDAHFPYSGPTLCSENSLNDSQYLLRARCACSEPGVESLSLV